MSATHNLKTWPQFFDAVARGDKNFEVRKDDRAFQTGDTLVLEYFDPTDKLHQGWREPLVRTVTFVLRGGEFGVETGYVVMGIIQTEGRADAGETVAWRGNQTMASIDKDSGLTIDPQFLQTERKSDE